MIDPSLALAAVSGFVVSTAIWIPAGRMAMAQARRDHRRILFDLGCCPRPLCTGHLITGNVQRTSNTTALQEKECLTCNTIWSKAFFSRHRLPGQYVINERLRPSLTARDPDPDPSPPPSRQSSCIHERILILRRARSTDEEGIVERRCADCGETMGVPFVDTPACEHEWRWSASSQGRWYGNTGQFQWHVCGLCRDVECRHVPDNGEEASIIPVQSWPPMPSPRVAPNLFGVSPPSPDASEPPPQVVQRVAVSNKRPVNLDD